MSSSLNREVILASPNLLAPEDGDREQPSTPSFWWESVQGASEYEVRIARDPDALLGANKERITHVASGAFYEATPGELEPGARYHWLVIARDGEVESEPSATSSFTVSKVIEAGLGFEHTAPEEDEVDDEATTRPGGGREISHSLGVEQEVREMDILMDRYEITGRLGAGGFATVYRAVDNVLNREVALKVLKPELLSNDKVRQDFLARFTREAQIVASLEHPHLVPVYDTGIAEVDGYEKPFIVMKLLDGVELEDVIAEGPIPLARARVLASHALEALDFVHSKGIVHKDLKPTNFFISEDHRGNEHLHIMDFGIAHDDNDEGGRLTKTGSFSGTVQYLAPEYTLYQEVSPRVDVYQMGLIIVEMLTGQPVISNETSLPQLIGLHIKGEPLELPFYFQGLRSGEVFARAIAPDPEERYADAGEFLEAFNGLRADDFPPFVGGSGTMLMDAPQTSREDAVAPPSTPMRPVLIGLGGAILCAVVGLGVLLATGNKDKDTKPTDAPVVASTKSDTDKPAVVTTPEVNETSPAVAEKKPEEKAPEGPEMLSFDVTTTPSGASVLVNGEEHGVSPVSFELAAGEGTFDLEIRQRNYRTLREEISLDKGQSLKFSLKRRASKKDPDEKPPVEKKPEEKTPIEKKPEEKPPVEKKPEEKKPEEKKPEEKREVPTLPPDF